MLHMFVRECVMVLPVFTEGYEMVHLMEFLTTPYYEQFANL